MDRRARLTYPMPRDVVDPFMRQPTMNELIDAFLKPLPRKGRPNVNNSDSRFVQVKAAVSRREKKAFEKLAEKREDSLSNLIRDHLLKELEKEKNRNPAFLKQEKAEEKKRKMRNSKVQKIQKAMEECQVEHTHLQNLCDMYFSEGETEDLDKALAFIQASLQNMRDSMRLVSNLVCLHNQAKDLSVPPGSSKRLPNT